MLKHLSLAEMAAIGLGWVDGGALNKTFLSILEIAPLAPPFSLAHEAILAVQPASRGLSPELRKVNQEGNIVDARHDHLGRGVSIALEFAREMALAEDPPDIDRADKCAAVAKQLFPDGLHVLNASWLFESGNTARVQTLLDRDPTIRPFLETIPGAGNQTLLDVVDRWIEAGKELGKLDAVREDLRTKDVIAPDRTTIQAARSQWIRVVATILNNLDLSSASIEAIEAIRGPVLRASDRAGKRYPGREEVSGDLDPVDEAPEPEVAPPPAP